MRITPDKINKLDGKTCFICGKYLLNSTPDDLAYMKIHTGGTSKIKPDTYFLFSCPNCNKYAHKRCWYNIGERKRRKGLFGKEWQLFCPSCGQALSTTRSERVDWKRGYEIPGHPDSELLELQVSDVMSWKAGSVFGKIGRAIDNFFQAVGLGSLSDPERNSVGEAAQRIGKTIQDVAERVFRLNIPEEKRSEIRDLKCQNCGAPLPLPGEFEDAVVCAHCGTAHLLR
ncbi:MAG: hypothetical protein EAX87_00780 [Candidatus Thorarchaeota archaeon]|nr:hypothetical protein [Candidatus Thorarchaeota archaeon]